MSPANIGGVLFGLAFVVAGAFAQRRIHRLAKATSVPGTIIGFERRSTGRAVASFPTIEFDTLTGDSRRATVQQGKVFTRVKVGNAVTVIYDPKNPRVAYIGSVGLRYGCYVFVVFGLGFMALALAAAAASR